MASSWDSIVPDPAAVQVRYLQISACRNKTNAVVRNVLDSILLRDRGDRLMYSWMFRGKSLYPMHAAAFAKDGIICQSRIQ